MSKNAKLIIILLAAVVVVSIFMTLSSSSQKTALQQEKNRLQSELSQYQERELKLTQENRTASDQLKEAQAAQGKLQKQLSEVSDKIASITAERNDWKTRVEDLKKERDQLIAKLQEKPEVPAMPSMPAAISSMQTPSVPSAAGEDGYWGQILKEKAGLEIQLNDLQSKLSQTAVQIEELKKKNSDLDLELSQLKNEKEDITRRVKYSEDLVNTLSVDLAREKNDKRYVAERAEKIREENLGLRAQVKELTASRMALEKNFAQLSEDKNSIEGKLATTESIIQNRIDEVLDIKKTLDKKIEGSSGSSKEIELPPIIVNAAPAESKEPKASGSSSGPGFNGRVMSINAESNFVIVDLGQDSGIQVGDQLSVYRGSKYIAGLEVIQVRQDISAADIKQKGAKIKVGDTVK